MAPVFALALALTGIAAPASAQILSEPTVTDYSPEKVAAEIEQFKAVGDGIVLTLAACEEQPHCVTAMSRHELERLIDRIQKRIDHLHSVRRDGDGGLVEPFRGFLQQYERLRDRYARQLGEVHEVTQRVDQDALEKDWEELLTFEAQVREEEQGTDVPEANTNVTLERFADGNEPLPVE